MDNQHKNSTISFRITDAERKQIKARIDDQYTISAIVSTAEGFTNSDRTADTLPCHLLVTSCFNFQRNSFLSFTSISTPIALAHFLISEAGY